MIELLDLSRAKLKSPGISEDVVTKISETLASGGRILVWMNRRWARRAFLCEDCGHMFSCSRCDLPLAFHISPKRKLLCHHCSLEMEIPSVCPHCHGSRFKGVGLGIQEVEEWLKRAFSWKNIVRLDSDASAADKNFMSGIEQAQIVIATELIHKTQAGEFELVFFPMIENELSGADFDTEERLYTNVRHALSYAKHAFIQTYSPKLPIIEDIVSGNYKTFLSRTLEERKRFNYPPYAEIAYIRVSDKNENRVFDTIAKLKNKLDILCKEQNIESDIFFDSKEIYTKRADEYIGKIVIKGPQIDPLLHELRSEIMRNPHVRLERR